MGKHSTPAEDADLPVFKDATGEVGEGSDVALRITCLPHEAGPGVLAINFRPFMHVQLAKTAEEPNVVHVQVLYGGGLENMDHEDGLGEVETNTKELARYFREVAEMIEQGGEIAQAKTDAERAADDDAWADFLTRAADDRLVVSDSEVGDPDVLKPGQIDYRGGAAFATDRVGKSPAQQDADDLAMLGAEPLIEEIVEAELMDEEE